MANNNRQESLEQRNKEVTHISFVGIIANVALAATKLIAGLTTHSIAFVLDAVNSLTDAFASIVTIIGTKLAAMRPSREHPYGYGRVEYITSIVIAAIILAAGAMSLWESAKKILHPSEPTYTTLALIIMMATVVVKIIIGIYFRRRGKAIDSQPLVASGVDALYDALLTTGTVVSAIFCMATHIDIDGWVGAVISIFIIKAGFDILKDAMSTIIGERPDPSLVHSIKTCVNDHEGVLGVYDMFLDSFGPNDYVAALNIEVPDDMTAHEIHDLSRHIKEEIKDKYNCTLTIGVYATNMTGDYAPIRNKLMTEAAKYPEVIQIHGFYVDVADAIVDFDIVVDFHADDAKIRNAIVKAMKEDFPAYTFNVVLDSDFIE